MNERAGPVSGAERCGARRLEIVVGAARDGQPFALDAVVIEQDRDLVLDPDVEVAEPAESVEKLLTAVAEAKRPAPGTVLVKATAPLLELLAIIHDFSEEPSWREAWIAAALDGVFHEVDARAVASLGMPLLGTVHGRLAPERAAELVAASLARVRPRTLERLWLLASAGRRALVARSLRRAGYRVVSHGAAADE